MIHYAVTASPFARKVRVTAIEKGLADPGMTAPGPVWWEDQGLVSANPLAKVPTLVTDDGQGIFDSRVICEYLDSLAAAPRLVPTDGLRWEVLTRAALADGIMDAAVAARGESVRPDGERSQANIDKQMRVVVRGIDRLEADAERFATALRIDSIGVACTLGYLDLRFASLGWRDGRPKLASFYASFAARPSMEATRPQV